MCPIKSHILHKKGILFYKYPQIEYLAYCVPTLYINYYRNIDIVLYLFISDFIALACKDDMLEKVPKIKDFYIVRLCSNTQVSTCPLCGNISTHLTRSVR